MMTREDAKQVIKSLIEKPFVCGKDFIETDNGYLIIKKESRNDKRNFR